MRVLIVGAGAIGSVLGGFLAESGHAVTLLGRPWHLDAVRREGLRISGLWGEHRIHRLNVATTPEAVPEPSGFDWVFFCVKAHQTAATAALLPRFLGRETLVCAFQNGLGNYEILTQHLPPARVALGRVIFGVEIQPGSVRVTVCADEVLLGAPDGAFPGERVAQLAAALDAAGIPSRATTTIMTALWAKVLYNCALNGLSTLFEVPYGRLPDYPPARRIIGAVIEEAYRVAKAQRVQLEPGDAQAYLDLLFARLIPDTAAHRPSMLQDLRRGRPSEIESMNGALARLAEAAGIAAPANRLIVRLIHTKERFAGLAVPA